MNSWGKAVQSPMGALIDSVESISSPGNHARLPVASLPRFVASAAEMRKIYAQIELLADMKVPVLITGESGTGKNTVAQILHQLSSRSQFPFCELACAGTSPEALEQMLFGTTGDVNKPGKIGVCAQGTIYLDEITELSPSLQARLLRFLADEHSMGLPAENSDTPTVRIAASAVDTQITRAIREKHFREDFYYRLTAFSIELPPLRRRSEDIPLLLTTFMEYLAGFYRRHQLPFSTRMMDACIRYPWPGNLRELENFVRRYLFIGSEANALNSLSRSTAGLAPAAHFSPTTFYPSAPPNVERGTGLKSLIRNLKGETELSAISNALQQTNWNRRQAARLLNISYRNMMYKIREYGLQPSFPPAERKKWADGNNPRGPAKETDP